MFEQLMYWFSRPVVGTYTGTMLKMDIIKYEQMPEGPKIVAANHPSTTDPFFVAAMIRQQAFILINGLLFDIPVFGEYLRRSGHIPVEAGNGPAAIESAVRRLEEGRTVVIFPEGALSPNGGGFQKARTGAARLALLSGAPVVPVGIHLEEQRIKRSMSNIRGQREEARWYLRGPYNMTVGNPLQFRGDVEDRTLVRTISDSIMHHIIELSRQSEIRMKQGPTSLPTLLETN